VWQEGDIMTAFLPAPGDTTSSSSPVWFRLDSPELCSDVPSLSDTLYRLSGSPIPRTEVMAPPANRLIDLLTRQYPAFERRQPLQAHVRRAVRMAMRCHTSALGGHVERCPNGHIERIFYNSCGHRFCPRCAGRTRRSWLIRQLGTLLPVRHYHVVFTLPHAVNPLWRQNPQVMGTLLFHSAVDALRGLLAEPERLGAEPGMTVTLETWDDRLLFHPHLHCLVTGGGLSPEGAWKDVPNPRCLVAVKPLMVGFRKRFCQGLRQLLTDEALTLPEETRTRHWLNRLNRVNRQTWAVFIAPPPEDGGPSAFDILSYQAQDVAGGPVDAARLLEDTPLSATQLAYLKSAPLSEHRLEDHQDERIRFRWGEYDPETGTRERSEIESLPPDEFLRRYLQHVPPPRYQTVRHYGLYTSAKKAAYAQARQILDEAGRHLPFGAVEIAQSPDTKQDTDHWRQAHTCPICGAPLVVSKLLGSSRTGKVIPRVKPGQILIRPPDSGGPHGP
jgi:hypothetical protein